MMTLGRRHLLLFIALVGVLSLLRPLTSSAQDDEADPPPDPPAEEPAAEDGEDAEDSEEPDGDNEDGDEDDDEEEDEEEEPPPPPQVSLQGLATGPVVGTDDELRSALFAVDFLETWHATTSTVPELSLVQVDGILPERALLLTTIDELIDTRETVAALLKASLDAATQRRGLEEDVDALEEQLAGLGSDRTSAIEVRVGLEADLDFIVEGVQTAAVGLYLNDQAGGLGLDDVGAFNDRRELAVRVDASLDDLLGQRDDLEAAIGRANEEIAALDEAIVLVEDEIEATQGRIASVQDTIDQIADEITGLTITRVQLELAMPEHIADAHAARLTATVSGLDISLVTLDAYVSAATDIPSIDPACGIRWEMLAGIAQIESNHARFGGAYVEPSGAIIGEILGPVLDGTLEGTAVITDSDGGSMDGNAEYDRAVGPFQFLPSTWFGFGLDSDGDDEADPHNLYDAALSAAGYLCASSNMVLDTDIERSVLSYNNSRHYLADTTAVAKRFIDRYGIPEAEFDPDLIEAADGWRIRFDISRAWNSGATKPA